MHTTSYTTRQKKRHRTKLGLQMSCFPCQNNVISGLPKRSGSIGLLLPSRDILRFLFLHNGRSVHDSEKKKSGANGGGQLAEILTHGDVCTYLRVNIQGVGPVPIKYSRFASRFATKPTQVFYIYNDVEMFVQFTSNFYT